MNKDEIIAKLLSTEGVRSLSNLPECEVKDSIRNLLGLEAPYEGQALRFISATSGVTYPDTAIDVVGDPKNDEILDASDCLSSRPPRAIYRNQLLDNYRRVVIDDFLGVKMEPAFYRLDSSGAILWGYSDGTLCGHEGGGYPFFTWRTLEALSGETLHEVTEGGGITYSTLRIAGRPHTIKGIFSKDAGETLYWFGDVASWRWSSPLSDSEVCANPSYVVVRRGDNIPFNSVSKTLFDAVEMSNFDKLEFMLHMACGYSFVKFTESKGVKYCEFVAQIKGLGSCRIVAPAKDAASKGGPLKVKVTLVKEDKGKRFKTLNILDGTRISTLFGNFQDFIQSSI